MWNWFKKRNGKKFLSLQAEFLKNQKEQDEFLDL